MNKENKTLPVPAQRKKIDPEKFLKRAALLKKNYQEEQGKPQDICQTHLHSFHKDIPEDVYCNHCEQPQFGSVTSAQYTSMRKPTIEEIMEIPIVKKYIRSNFIAKRDLRKLLEKLDAEKLPMGRTAKTGREVIDDIQAAIEKL